MDKNVNLSECTSLILKVKEVKMHKLGDKGDKGAGRVVRSNYKINLSLPST